MEVLACRECRRLFNYLSGPQICTGCKEKLEGKFEEVKEYLEDHPGAGLMQVLEACKVKKTYVTQWMKEGRIELEDCLEMVARCDRCGSPIPEGSFCNKCKREFVFKWNELEAQDNQPEEAEEKDRNTPRMRFGRRAE